MPVSAENIQYCKRLCETASKRGFRLKELDTELFGHSFVWLTPRGQQVSGSIQRDRQVAFVDACASITSHIFSHV
jgi:hypothetical protein